jgi:hypothetical protein
MLDVLRPRRRPRRRPAIARVLSLTPYGDAGGALSPGTPTYKQITIPTRDRASLHQSGLGVQSIPSVTRTAISFDTLDYDIGSLSNLGAQPTRLTVPADAGPGAWLIQGWIIWAANVTGSRAAYLVKNGSAIDLTAIQGPPDSAGACAQPVHYCDNNPSPGDYYELYVYQSSGGALNTAPGTALQATHLW